MGEEWEEPALEPARAPGETAVVPGETVRVPASTGQGAAIPDAVEYPLAGFPWPPWTGAHGLTAAQAEAYAAWLNEAGSGRLAVIQPVLHEAGAPVTGLRDQPARLLALGSWIQDWFPVLAAPLVAQRFIYDDAIDRLGHAWADWRPPRGNYSRCAPALLHSLALDVAFVVADCARAARPGLHWQPAWDPGRQAFVATIDPGPPVFDLLGDVKDFLVQTVAQPRGRRGRELREWYSRALYRCFRQASTGVAPPDRAQEFPDLRCRLEPRYRLARPVRTDAQAPRELTEAVAAFRHAGWFGRSKLPDADLARSVRAAWRTFERADITAGPAAMHGRLLLLDTSRTWSEDVDAGSRPGDGLHSDTLFALDNVIGTGAGHPADVAEDWSSRPGDLVLSFSWGRSRRELLIPAPGRYLSPALFTGLNAVLPAGRQRLWFCDQGPSLGIVTRATGAERDELERRTGIRLSADPPVWWASLAPLPAPSAPRPARQARTRPHRQAASPHRQAASPRRRKPAAPGAPPPASAQDLFQHLMRDLLAPAFRDLGLTGTFRSFSYRAGDLEGAAGARKSRYSSNKWVDFTIGLGAAHAPTRAGYWFRELPGLVPQAQHYWWRVTAGQPPEPVAADIVRAFRDYGWPAILAALDSPGFPPDPATRWARTFPPAGSDAAKQASRSALEPIRALLAPAGREHDRDFAGLADDDATARMVAAEIIGDWTADDPRAVPALLNRLAHDPSAYVRRTAAEQLRPLAGRGDVGPALHAAAAGDEDLEVRWEARYALRLARPDMP